MTSTDQKRAMLLTKLLVGEITVTEAATLTRGELGTLPPGRATITVRPAPDHPWRQLDRRSKLYRRLTESVAT